jgi:hypothetical protein
VSAFPLGTELQAANLANMPVSKGRKKANKRPTPPKNPTVSEVSEKGPSPTWYVATMFGLMAVGIIVILLNYMGILPGQTNNWYLIAGLAMIGVGFAMTLNYR